MQRTNAKDMGIFLKQNFVNPSMEDFLLSLNITVTSQLGPWRPQSPAYGLFARSFIQAHIRENIKAAHHWTL